MTRPSPYTPRPTNSPAERTVPLRTFDSIPAEQTAQLCIAGLWQWPDTDPDNHPKIIMEARAALRSCECPPLAGARIRTRRTTQPGTPLATGGTDPPCPRWKDRWNHAQSAVTGWSETAGR